MSNISSTNMLATHSPGIQPPLSECLEIMDRNEQNFINGNDLQLIKNKKNGEGAFGGGLIAAIVGLYTTNRSLGRNRFGPFIDAVILMISCIGFFILGCIGFFAISGEPSSQELLAYSNSGDDCLNAVRYRRLRGKIAHITVLLTDDSMTRITRTHLELAKSHFETTVNLFERNVNVHVHQ